MDTLDLAALERDAALAQVATLRAALADIARQCGPGAGECPDCEKAQRWALMALPARAALGEAP